VPRVSNKQPERSMTGQIHGTLQTLVCSRCASIFRSNNGDKYTCGKPTVFNLASTNMPRLLWCMSHLCTSNSCPANQKLWSLDCIRSYPCQSCLISTVPATFIHHAALSSAPRDVFCTSETLFECLQQRCEQEWLTGKN
jgi:hypothetical protein